MAAAVPAELKAISPYLARATELEKAEPVISYWCTYYALQQAMSLGSKDPESQVYLFELMDKLEQTKAEHATEEAFTDDIAAAAYIENFGLKLFSQADTEDRKGKATRLTARKFLAAANFLELLAIFGEVGTENRERIKYAKWKATDIAKAFREGRKPTPGPAGGLQEGEEDAADPSKVSADEAKELSREFEALDTQREASAPAEREAAAPDAAQATSPSAEADDSSAFVFPQQPTTLPSAPPTDDAPDFLDEAPEFDTATPVNDRTSTAPDPFDSSPAADLSSSMPPPESHQTAELPPPHAHLPSEPPAFPSAVFPSAPELPPQPPSTFHPPTSHPAQSPPTFAAAAPRPPASAPPAPATATIAAPPKLDNFDTITVAQVQKHAKWAISALNYDDFETARKELRLALAMLGG
ncbi:hypothetical protein JCM10908_003847 [Rhodotorula pacifica]|uniref:Vta1p n=1 Tax=Rhodotorula pacifica TaxID=1495444 RepID=UPI00316FD9E7